MHYCTQLQLFIYIFRCVYVWVTGPFSGLGSLLSTIWVADIKLSRQV